MAYGFLGIVQGKDNKNTGDRHPETQSDLLFAAR